jgi:hypothetical protein
MVTHYTSLGEFIDWLQDLDPDAVMFFAYQGEDHREVVRRKAPKHVLFASDLAQIEAVGIEILQWAKRSRPDHVA